MVKMRWISRDDNLSSRQPRDDENEEGEEEDEADVIIPDNIEVCTESVTEAKKIFLWAFLLMTLAPTLPHNLNFVSRNAQYKDVFTIEIPQCVAFTKVTYCLMVHNTHLHYFCLLSKKLLFSRIKLSKMSFLDVKLCTFIIFLLLLVNPASSKQLVMEYSEETNILDIWLKIPRCTEDGHAY